MWFVLMALGVLLTIFVWSRFGPIWGVISGVLLIGGVGWKLLASAAGALAPNRTAKMEFAEAWEARAGEMQFGVSKTYPPRGAYQAWQQDKANTRESAWVWMDRTMGVARPAEIQAYGGEATNQATGQSIHPWQSVEFARVRAVYERPFVGDTTMLWQILNRGDVGYYESLAFVLNKHLGWSRLGRRYLQDLVDGVSEEESIRRSVEWLLSDGNGLLRRMSQGGAPADDAHELVTEGIGMVRYYTGAGHGAELGYEGAPELAAAALRDSLTPERVHDVPQDHLPEKIAGFGVSSTPESD